MPKAKQTAPKRTRSKRAKPPVATRAKEAAVTPPRRRLVSVWHLSTSAALTLWAHKKLFIGVTVTYGLLNLILVQGLAGHTDVSSLKSQFDQIFHGNFGPLASSLVVFATLLGSSGNGTSSTAGAYQGILVLIGSLAVIWALRQVAAGARPRIRDTFYKGMTPLIPFVLVLLIIGLQLLPLLIGASIYSLVISNGIAVLAIEKALWAVLFAGLALWSLYMVSSSTFALYIVTLPDMTPLKALRSARELVRGRRWTVLRKLLFLPVLLLVVATVIMLPIIILLTPLAQWTFYALTMLALPAVHGYLYTLYRGLLDE